jgi:AcrR family transcriptional regulator
MIQAARDLILTENSFAGFTIDAVAQRAGVARMTVYYQFKSKRGLLEALLDELATRGGMERMAQAFGMPEPKAALGHYFEVFGDFWSSDREVMRRLRSFSVLDREFGQGIEVRSQWRRQGALVLVTRLNEAFGHPHADSLEQAADILFTLTSFDTFDALAGENHSPAEMAPILYGIALAAFGLKTA